MCLAIPMQVKEIAQDTAICEIDGVLRNASLMMLDSVEVGDYVLIHAGFAIEKLDLEEAEKTLALFREMASREEELS